MWTIEPLSPSQWAAYQKLMPSELRSALNGVTGASGWVVFGAHLLGTPIGLAVAYLPETGHSAQLRWVGVIPAYRRLGLGASLVRAVLQALMRRGATRCTVTRSDEDPALAEKEQRLLRLGWRPFAPQSFRYVAESDRLMPVFRAVNRPLPAGFSVVPWDTVTREEVEALRTDPEESVWKAACVPPYDAAGPARPDLGVALRHRGELAGWHLLTRLDDDTMESSRLYVREALRGCGVGMILIAAGIGRAAADYRKIAWTVRADNAGMAGLTRRFFEPVAERKTTYFVATLALPNA